MSSKGGIYATCKRSILLQIDADGQINTIKRQLDLNIWIKENPKWEHLVSQVENSNGSSN